jgi:3-isopropylmalate dehydratase small subunit
MSDSIELRGMVVKTFEKDISTDIIYPGAYLYCTDTKRTPQFCFKVRGDEEFNRKLVSGEIPPRSIIVADANFGCGSSRAQAASSIAGHKLIIIAKSFARIFLKNACNCGIRTFIVPNIEATEGDVLYISKTEIRNERSGKVFSITPHQPNHQDLIDAGGLIPYVTNLLRAKLRGEEV